MLESIQAVDYAKSEDLLVAVVGRLEVLQKGPNRCPEYGVALNSIKMALGMIQQRDHTKDMSTV